MKSVIFAIVLIASTSIAVAHEPIRIPVYGRGPVVGHYEPALVRAPTLFPWIFGQRYRRALVYRPLPQSPAAHHVEQITLQRVEDDRPTYVAPSLPMR